MKVLDFSASLPNVGAIKNAGYGGVMLYCAPGRETWMRGKQPPKSYIDQLNAAGIKTGFVWQYGGASNPDAMRGRAGGIADAKAADAYLKSVGKSGLPVIFAVDFDITLNQDRKSACRERV